MSLPYDVITFDCYGTLIDWERGIRDAFAAVAAAIRRPVNLDAALALYVETEAQVEAEPYRAYREVLRETATRIAARLEWRLPESRAGFLAESMPAWPPFPDTNRGLVRLDQAGYRLHWCKGHYFRCRKALPLDRLWQAYEFVHAIVAAAGAAGP